MPTELGFLLNPVAGLGGRVGLHGTDGRVAEALALGARPVAPARAARALAALPRSTRLVTVAGPMGGDLLTELGRPHRTVVFGPAEPSTAADTRATVAELAAEGVALLLFTGGDGTARDVLAVVGADLPVLGVPSGVKMHSGVFAAGPEAAGESAAAFLAAPERFGTAQAEVVDLDSGAPRLFGVARVPAAGRAIVRAKSAGPSGAAEAAGLAALGRSVAAALDPARLWLIGPGTTAATVSAALGLPSAPLGVDAVLDGELLARDAGERELLMLLGAHPKTTLVLGVVGGQGFLLGRGNQQLSAGVLAAVGAANIEILASPGKIAALDPPVLRVDVDGGFPEILGYRRVHTAPGQSTVLQVVG